MAKKPAAKKRNASERRYDDILYEVKDQVAWVTINRPRVMNAFREQTLDELIDALKSTRDDPSIACAVVTGTGDKAFSAGGDFYAMKRLNWINGAGAWAAATSWPCGAIWSSRRRTPCSGRPGRG